MASDLARDADLGPFQMGNSAEFASRRGPCSVIEVPNDAADILDRLIDPDTTFRRWRGRTPAGSYQGDEGGPSLELASFVAFIGSQAPLEVGGYDYRETHGDRGVPTDGEPAGKP